MSLKLHYEILGRGEPLIILHGLFGSSANWRSIAAGLAPPEHSQHGCWQVVLPDLRNHGASPHSPTHRYTDMVGDILGLMDTLKLERAHILGHSLGGKAAMLLASRAAERVQSLTVVDIAPRAYAPLHHELFAVMNALPLHSLRSRMEASAWMSRRLPNPEVRDFLLTNLVRERSGQLHWRINLPTLEMAYDDLNAMPFLDRLYAGPALFIRGGHSDYVRDADLGLIRESFPQACVISLPLAHHWPHIETPDAFLKTLRSFLQARRERLPCEI
ncbi:MAG: alpha/beta fold hydrolase [Halothiobacillaceae bacterium]|nr:alpha/beta fold hydrolase [Halothiobacillaceae bacterium]